MSCLKNKNVFILKMGYFFRIWAKTRLTFKLYRKNMSSLVNFENVRRVLAQIQGQTLNILNKNRTWHC